jgi:hypothetical protein
VSAWNNGPCQTVYMRKSKCVGPGRTPYHVIQEATTADTSDKERIRAVPPELYITAPQRSIVPYQWLPPLSSLTSGAGRTG